MARLQFRHYDEAFNSRQDAEQYIKDVVNESQSVANVDLANAFGPSLFAEPIVVKYKDENEEEHVILAIGKQNEGNVPYHIIDSAKYEEDINAISGLTEELKEQIEEEIAKMEELSDRVDQLESAITETQEAIDQLSEETIKGIEINNTQETDWEGDHGKGIVARVENNIAYFDNFSTDNVKIPDGFEGEFIHHDHSLTDFLKEVEGLRIKKMDDISDLREDVKEAYQLITANGTVLGDTIKLYKDSSLKDVEFTNVDAEGNPGQYLKFTYIDYRGEEKIVYLNVSELIVESEFADGLKVNNHVVSVKIDETSEPFISVGPDGIKINGIQAAITSSVTAEQERAEEAEDALQEGINALQTELDATQTGAGLNADGTYVHDHPTNYIDEAISLADADHKLDAALKNTDNKVSEIESNLNAEISRATAKENEIEANLVSEINRSTEKDSALESAINAERERAVAKENELDSKIDTTKTELQEAIDNSSSELEGMINTEITNRESADTEITNKLSELSAATRQEISDRQNAVSQLTNSLSEEVNRASEKENELDGKIDDAVTLINTEITDRETADSALSDRIDVLEGKTIVGSKAILVNGTDEKVVSLLLADDEKILSQNNAGLKTTLNVDIVKENSKDYIVLKGIDGQEISRVDASDFIKDGMLDSVSWVEDTAILEFVFNTDSGKESIKINFSQFLNDEVNRQIEELKEAIRILNGDVTVPGSVDHTLDDRLVKYAVAGSAIDANGTLIRYYEDASGHKYYVSNKSEDMTYKGDNLADTIEGMLTKIDSIGDDIEERIAALEDTTSDLWQALSAETIARQTADDELWDALSAETTDRIAADDALWEALSAETALRELKDNELEDLINNIDVPSIDNLFASASYNSSDKKIYFYNTDGEQLPSVIDANDFIKDGMVDTVAVSGSSLVITFNTDSGKEDIEIPLTSFFNPDNYYTKDEIIDAEEVVAAAINDLNNRILSLSGLTGVISTNVQNNYNSIQNLNEQTEDIYDKLAEISGRTVDLSGYYTKTEADDKFLTKAVFEEKEEVISAAFNDLNDKLSDLSGETINISNNLINISGITEQNVEDIEELKTRVANV